MSARRFTVRGVPPVQSQAYSPITTESKTKVISPLATRTSCRRIDKPLRTRIVMTLNQGQTAAACGVRSNNLVKEPSKNVQPLVPCQTITRHFASAARPLAGANAARLRLFLASLNGTSSQYPARCRNISCATSPSIRTPHHAQRLAGVVRIGKPPPDEPGTRHSRVPIG